MVRSVLLLALAALACPACSPSGLMVAGQAMRRLPALRFGAPQGAPRPEDPSDPLRYENLVLDPSPAAYVCTRDDRSRVVLVATSADEAAAGCGSACPCTASAALRLGHPAPP